jgi:Multiubiquitin
MTTTENRGHQTVIIVNAREMTVTGDEVSFEQLVAFAFPGAPVGDGQGFAITYKRGPDHKPEGTLAPGTSVKVKKGMVVNVSQTNRS